MNKSLKFLWLLPALGLYSWLCWFLNFTQDDAYISYRYIQNFLNGNGLVWNIGERVEGFTNFGWVTYLILWGGIGLNYIAISKISGFLCGAGALVISWLIADRLLEGKQLWFSLVAPYLVAVNFAFAYWSPAGLETAAFAFVSILAIYLFLLRSPYLIAALAIAVWIRPEGAVLAGLLVIVDYLLTRQLWGYALRSGLVAFVLSLPYVGFKLFYYGSVLPNPFYAKTGSSLAQVQSGVGYVWLYLQHYGLLGLSAIIPLIFWKRLSWQGRAVLLIYLGYVLYIVAVGGDVLPVHRFFVPLFGLNAALAAMALWLLLQRGNPALRYFALTLVTAAALACTVFIPRETVLRFNYYEKGFTDKMQFLAERMKAANQFDFSVALPTIGIFGYTLIGHDIIDLVGLTDSTIARHPESPVEGMATTWKERNFNTPYLLSREPDYVVFSTSMKPSAPAERALMLYPQFLESYRLQSWVYQHPIYSKQGITIGAFRKVRDFAGPFERRYPLAWVNEYKAALEAYNGENYAQVAKIIEQIRANPSSPLYPEMLFLQAVAYTGTKQDERGFKLMDSVIAIDSLTEGAHKTMYFVESMLGDPAKAARHRAWLQRLAPWEMARMDSTIAQKLKGR